MKKIISRKLATILFTVATGLCFFGASYGSQLLALLALAVLFLLLVLLLAEAQ